MSAVDDEQLVEIMAKAAYANWRRLPNEDRWNKVTEKVREDFRGEARAALSAIEAAGYQIRGPQ